MDSGASPSKSGVLSGCRPCIKITELILGHDTKTQHRGIFLSQNPSEKTPCPTHPEPDTMLGQGIWPSRISRSIMAPPCSMILVSVSMLVSWSHNDCCRYSHCIYMGDRKKQWRIEHASSGLFYRESFL